MILASPCRFVLCVALGFASGPAQAVPAHQPPAPATVKKDPDAPEKSDIEAVMKSIWEHPRSRTEAQTTLHINSIDIAKPRAITREDRLDRPGLPAEGKLTPVLIDFTVKTYEDDRTRVDRRTREAVAYKDEFGKWRVDTGAIRGKDTSTVEPAQKPEPAKPGTPMKGDSPGVTKKGDAAAKKFEAPKLSYGKQEWDVAALEQAFIIHKCFQNDKPIPEVEFLFELKADSSRMEATKWTMILQDADGVELLTGYLSFSPADWKKGDKLRAVYSRGVENAYKEQWQKATKVIIKHE